MSLLSKTKGFKDQLKQGKEAYKMKKQMEDQSYEASELEGKIRLKINGLFDIKELHVDQSLLSSDNQNKIENGIKDAFKAARKQLEKSMAARAKEEGGLDFLNK